MSFFAALYFLLFGGGMSFLALRGLTSHPKSEVAFLLLWASILFTSFSLIFFAMWLYLLRARRGWLESESGGAA
jgi:hypothetical protein